MKYNFVIFATTFDWYKIMYSEVLERPDVRFYQDINEFFSPVERTLYKLHMSRKVNRVISLPNKERWFKKVVNQIQFENQNPVCFIWYSHFVREIKRGMLDYIKMVLPDSKHVMYYTDAKNVKEEEISQYEFSDLLEIYSLSYMGLLSFKNKKREYIKRKFYLFSL